MSEDTLQDTRGNVRRHTIEAQRQCQKTLVCWTDQSRVGPDWSGSGSVRVGRGRSRSVQIGRGRSGSVGVDSDRSAISSEVMRDAIDAPGSAGGRGRRAQTPR